jgi:hypothetical protein
LFDFGAFVAAPDHEDWAFEDRGFFLDATGVGDEAGGMSDEGEQHWVVQRCGQVEPGSPAVRSGGACWRGWSVRKP